jgi:drug/metabolite transporter (DMT)-like permease
MVTSIEGHQFKHVICKSLLGVIYISCLYTAIKYLPLVVASLIQNLSPLFTAIFSCIFLKKGLTKLKTAVLIVSFIGVVVMLTGKLELTLQIFDPDPDIMEDDVDEDEKTLTDEFKQITVSLIVPITMMMCVPIMNAFITILFAKMRGLSEFTVCSY